MACACKQVLIIGAWKVTYIKKPLTEPEAIHVQCRQSCEHGRTSLRTLSCLMSRYVCKVYTRTLNDTTSFSQGMLSGMMSSAEKVM